MASNITQIGDAIENLSLNFTTPNTTNILQTAIETNNNNTDGLFGLMLFLIMTFSVLIWINLNKQKLQLFDPINQALFGALVTLDIGIYLLIWGILTSFQVYFFVYTCFIVVGAIALLRKEMLNNEV